MALVSHHYALRLLISFACFLMLAGCDPQPLAEDRPVNTQDQFEHAGDGKTPWLNQAPNTGTDKFSFAIIGDVTGGEREGMLEVASAQLVLLQPDLVISIGDIIEGGTLERETFNHEFDAFDAAVSGMNAPLVRISGNNELTHPTVRDFWNDRYGPRYSFLRYRDALFLFLDSEDMSDARMRTYFEDRSEAIRLFGEGKREEAAASAYMSAPERNNGAIGTDQAAYFTDALAEHTDVRWTFLFVHKPVWRNSGESGEGGAFADIETALKDRPYTVFTGHFHKVGLEERMGRDYIALATTGGALIPNSDASFDHVTVVTVSEKDPTIAHIRMDGIITKNGTLPADGDTLCFKSGGCETETE